MKTIDEYLSENVKPVNFDKVLNVGKINIFEAEDPMAADPLGGGRPGRARWPARGLAARPGRQAQRRRSAGPARR